MASASSGTILPVFPLWTVPVPESPPSGVSPGVTEGMWLYTSATTDFVTLRRTRSFPKLSIAQNGM